MVDSQVRPSDITDRRIIRAMGQVPREMFVPAALRAIAYMDNPVPFTRGGNGRSLVEPRLYAKLVQLAAIADGGRVLEIGSGTGYGIAVMTAMGLKAIGLEENADLTGQAALALAAAGYPATLVKAGPHAQGLPADGPFDAIIFAGAAPAVPAALFDQLKSGGRLVAVIGDGPGAKATVWVRSGMTFDPREAFDAAASALPGFDRPARFVF